MYEIHTALRTTTAGSAPGKAEGSLSMMRWQCHEPAHKKNGGQPCATYTEFRTLSHPQKRTLHIVEMHI